MGNVGLRETFLPRLVRKETSEYQASTMGAAPLEMNSPINSVSGAKPFEIAPFAPCHYLPFSFACQSSSSPMDREALGSTLVTTRNRLPSAFTS